MKIDMPNVPELDAVSGAVAATIYVTKEPSGLWFQTVFLDANGDRLRQDQHLIADPSFLELRAKAGY
jgi:hypothetical protein